MEYFSAISDPAYEEFVEKLHDLLNREDIQIILKSGEGKQRFFFQKIVNLARRSSEED